MKILIGHTNQIPELNHYRTLPGREAKFDDVLAFGNGYAQVAYRDGMAWEELLAVCPSGWKPDVYIHWSPEYNLTPSGLENAECFTIGVMGDWMLGGVALRTAGGVFDLLAADKEGCQALNAAGFTNTLSALLWGYDPALHRLLPEVEKDIDVLMIGNFNHAVQYERSRWLSRVARLSEKYRVVLTSGITGDAYTHTMNRAKIVFNRSVAGGVNMRVYEALACGSLLFYERENPEIQTLFKDRQHCVLYGEDDFEALIGHYLAPENSEERHRITRSGQTAVAPYSYARQLSRFLTEIEPLVMAHRRKQSPLPPRSLLNDEARKLKLLTLQTHLSDSRSFDAVAANLLHALQETEGAQKTDLLLLRSVLECRRGNALQPPYREGCFLEAAALIQQGLFAEPDQVSALTNLGSLSLALQRREEAEAAFQAALSLLESPLLAARQLRGLVYSPLYDTFDVERERLWLDHAPGSEAWIEKTRTALAHRIHATLGEAAFAAQEFEKAEAHLRRAAEYRPRSGSTAYGLASALRALRRPHEALEAYERAIENSPFLFGAWQDRASLLLEEERAAEAAELLNEFLTILEACPIYAEAHAYFTDLRDKIAPAAQKQAATQDSRITRLIALPDWDNPAQWQPLLRDYVGRCTKADSVVLLLPIPPDRYPDPALIVTRLSDYLTETLGLSPEKIPGVSFLTEPIESMIRAHALPIVDGVLAVGGDADREFAAFLGVPLLGGLEKCA